MGVDVENISFLTRFYTSQVVGNGISEPSTVRDLFGGEPEIV